ncbi:YbfB/YjiJ family MFS transporter [[Eubacterium] cellulosolvens]
MSPRENVVLGYRIIFSGFIAVLASIGFARFGYSMILPGMKDGLLLTYSQVGFMESANFLGYMIFAILGGVLSWKYGPRIVITLSLLLVGVSMVFTGFVTGFTQSVILRSLAGVGSGGANVPAMMLPAAWFSSKKRGLASGLIAAGSGAGIILSGFLVPRMNILFSSSGWRYSWFILGALTLIFALFCAILIQDPAKSQSGGSSLRLKGVIVDPLLWKIGVTYLMFGFSYIIYVTFFGAYLVYEVQLTSQLAGGLWALVGSLSLVSGPLWGHVSDRIGRGLGLAFVYLIHSLSFFLFTFKDIMIFLFASSILFGITAWSIPSIMAAYSGDRFGSQLAFSAFGILTIFFGVGQVFGPATAGLITDQTGTLIFPFFLSSAIALLGVFFSLAILRKD